MVCPYRTNATWQPVLLITALTEDCEVPSLSRLEKMLDSSHW